MRMLQTHIAILGALLSFHIESMASKADEQAFHVFSNRFKSAPIPDGFMLKRKVTTHKGSEFASFQLVSETTASRLQITTENRNLPSHRFKKAALKGAINGTAQKLAKNFSIVGSVVPDVENADLSKPFTVQVKLKDGKGRAARSEIRVFFTHYAHTMIILAYKKRDLELLKKWADSVVAIADRSQHDNAMAQVRQAPAHRLDDQRLSVRIPKSLSVKKVSVESDEEFGPLGISAKSSGFTFSVTSVPHPAGKSAAALFDEMSKSARRIHEERYLGDKTLAIGDLTVYRWDVLSPINGAIKSTYLMDHGNQIAGVDARFKTHLEFALHEPLMDAIVRSIKLEK